MKYNCNCKKIKYVPVIKITTLTIITVTVIKITTVIVIKITSVKDNYIKNYNCKRQLY